MAFGRDHSGLTRSRKLHPNLKVKTVIVKSGVVIATGTVHSSSIPVWVCESVAIIDLQYNGDQWCSGSVPGQSATVRGQFATIPGQFVAVPGHFATVPGQFDTVPGMPDFELRLVEGFHQGPQGMSIIQGRCSDMYEWGAICSNTPADFPSLKTGRVACHELGFADHAVETGNAAFDEVGLNHRPNYTLSVDIGCLNVLLLYEGVSGYDETAYLCGTKQLCGDDCQQIHPTRSEKTEFQYCQCDDACVLFDDCCYDYAEKCSKRGSSLTQQLNLIAELYDCAWLPGSQFTYKGFVVVSRCPSDWTDSGTRKLCEKPSNYTDVIGSLPVFDEGGVDYKNVYCALCNGMSLSGLQGWKAAATADSDTPWLVHPGLNQSLPSEDWAITVPPGHVAIRECPAHLVDTCTVEFHGSNIERACKEYYAPITASENRIRYRNPHCALCNGEHVVPQDSCLEIHCVFSCTPFHWGPCAVHCNPIDGFVTIEVLFDLSSSSLRDACSGGQIYDPFFERCRVLTCSKGYQISGDECVPMPTELPSWTESNTTTALQCLYDRLRMNISSRDITQFFFKTETNSSTSHVFVLMITSEQTLNLEMAIEIFFESTRDNRTIQNPFTSCQIEMLNLYLPFPLADSGVCPNYTIEGKEVFPGISNGTLLNVATYEPTFDGLFSKTASPTSCLRVTELSCKSLLIFDQVEFRNVSDELIELPETGMTFSPDQYVILSDGRALICSFLSEAGLEPLIRRIVAFVGNCVSLLALMASFFTYCVFKELRNLVGKCTMSLTAALFAALALFMLSGYLQRNHTLCLVAAVMAHYFWLSAFSWMTVISGNVARTFSSLVRRHVSDKTFIVCMIIAWGIPLIIISVCLALQFCNCTSLSLIYAEGDICWITDVTARLAAFVVPVAASLLLNICLYVFTLVRLRRSQKASRKVRKRTTRDAVMEELIIYTKVSILPFSYIYLILNYLQGVFIFFAFCFNERIRGLWGQKIHQWRQQKQKKSTITQQPPGIINTKTESTHL
ncbi:uncharacterized protein [Asterias amurensis]|uniref:uncharacterized protein n=1 Tax=Asterias amurensis TaxID=7602 RepID=UPI003AB3D394